MSDWTEYNSTMEWPESDNVEWQARQDGAWRDINNSRAALLFWEDGHRVRYRKRGDEMVKVYFSDDGSISYLGKVIDRWMFLAAPIAAYHKDMKYMACDEDGEVYVYEEMPSTSGQYWFDDINDNERIATIPKEAMPDNCKTAIVGLVHEEPGDE